MNINISPVTSYNSSVKDANGMYTVSTVIIHNVYRPILDFYENDIDNAIELLKQLLQYFKGEHTITAHKLVKCEPFEFKRNYGDRISQTRDWEIEFYKSVDVVVTEPKIAKVYAENGKSFGESGWFIKVNFNIDGIKIHDFGTICSSFKNAKEHCEWNLKHNEEIQHWEFQDNKKSRKVKCNDCEKQLTNLTAQQCSKCGKYYCEDCLTDDACSNCEFEN